MNAGLTVLRVLPRRRMGDEGCRCAAAVMSLSTKGTFANGALGCRPLAAPRWNMLKPQARDDAPVDLRIVMAAFHQPLESKSWRSNVVMMKIVLAWRSASAISS